MDLLLSFCLPFMCSSQLGPSIDVDGDSSTTPLGKILTLISLAEPTSGGVEVPQRIAKLSRDIDTMFDVRKKVF